MGVEPRKAAMYVRMSTDHQRYSTENQEDAILEYASHRNIEIITTYADAGKSGLNIGGREALQRLISDVETKKAEFSIILVLDVTRWGRFQDADESAYYEYICRRAGIDVQYVAEQFENDGSPVSTIVKGVKRAMAGEYSRELSAKVFAGQCRLIEKGFRQGGPAGYGLRRMLLDEQGNEKGTLKRGEHKSLQTDRVVLVPGPDDEIEMVRWIYECFVDQQMSEKEISDRLNAQGVLTDWERAWTRGVPEEKIAAALNIDARSIIAKRDLLKGICAEAAELLKDKMVPIATFPVLKRMKAFRQIEAATLMNDAGLYSKSYADALFAATPKDQLVNPEKPKKVKGLDEDQMARMESEMESLQREYRLIEENYGKDVLNLTLAKGYLGSLLGNAKVVRYLAQHNPDILSQFQKIADITSLSKEVA